MNLIRTVALGVYSLVLTGIVGGTTPASAGERSEPVPHTTTSEGTNDIAVARFEGPTSRYAHGVLGDAIEPSVLVVKTQAGEVLRVTLEDGSVFEDLVPRLFDLDADGRDEVWVVRADHVGGGRIEAYGLQDGRLRRVFAGPPIGLGYRWLNPVGVADFDGDGTREVAYVRTPHIGGVLTVLRPTDARVGSARVLEIVATKRGYSTHAIGSTRLDLAVIANLDDKPGAEIILPDQSRTQFAVVRFANGALDEIWRGTSGPGIAGDVRLERAKSGLRVRYLTLEGETSTTVLFR